MNGNISAHSLKSYSIKSCSVYANGGDPDENMSDEQTSLLIGDIDISNPIDCLFPIS